ncbi:Tim44 domain-containing protein, partial [Pseudoalteromonas undina]
LAGAAFIIFKLDMGFIRAKQPPQLAGNNMGQYAFKHAQSEQPINHSFSQQSTNAELVPYNLRPNFDVNC